MDVITTKNKFHLMEALNRKKHVIWTGEEKLHTVLEEVGGNINDSLKIAVKVCEEVEYKGGAIVAWAPPNKYEEFYIKSWFRKKEIPSELKKRIRKFFQRKFTLKKDGEDTGVNKHKKERGKPERRGKRSIEEEVVELTEEVFLNLASSYFETITIKRFSDFVNFIASLETTATQNVILLFVPEDQIFKTAEAMLYLGISEKAFLISMEHFLGETLLFNFSNLKAVAEGLRQILSETLYLVGLPLEKVDFSFLIELYNLFSFNLLVNAFACEKIVADIDLLTNTLNEKMRANHVYLLLGSKKAGKSSVINALIGKKYAPESSETPTPNIVIYEGVNIFNSKSVLITDETEGGIQIFPSSKDLYNHLFEMFEEKKYDGKKLGYIGVFFPLSQSLPYLDPSLTSQRLMESIKLVDTVGPDFAASEHNFLYQILEDLIFSSDLIIFVMDYSKHLQDIELKLLKEIADTVKKIKETGEESPAILCLINKIDVMEHDMATIKIPLRIAHFIKNKLHNLGLPEEKIIVIPVSAKLFSEVKQIEEAYPSFTRAQDVESFLKKIKKGSLNNHTLKFLQDAIDALKTVHEIETVSYHNLLEFSNFPAVIEFVKFWKRFRKYVKTTSLSVIWVYENLISELENLLAEWMDSTVEIAETLNKIRKVAKSNNKLNSKQLAEILKEVEDGVARIRDALMNLKNSLPDML